MGPQMPSPRGLSMVQVMGKLMVSGMGHEWGGGLALQHTLDKTEGKLKKKPRTQFDLYHCRRMSPPLSQRGHCKGVELLHHTSQAGL